MNKHIAFPLAAALSCIGPAIAAASSSQWAAVQGGAVRLVTSGEPNADGTLRAALQIDLKPGWKTYWRDPGDTGVPPGISITGASLAGIAYPVPQRFDEEGTVWNGYEAPVSFAVDLNVAGSKAGEIGAHVFLGICQSICIPLQAQLEVDPAADPANPDDAAVVTRAFEDVPGPAQPGFRLTGAKKDGSETLTVAAELPRPDAAAELFLAAPDGYSFGPPERLDDRSGKTAFSVPVYERADAAAGTKAAYTLVQNGKAVEGNVTLP